MCACGDEDPKLPKILLMLTLWGSGLDRSQLDIILSSRALV
jgi:hypothetical protein